MQSTTRALVAYAEWVHETTFDLGSAILTRAVEFSGLVVSRSQRSVSDGKTAYERPCPAHSYHTVPAAHKFLQAPLAMSQAKKCQLRSLRPARSSHSLSSYTAATS